MWDNLTREERIQRIRQGVKEGLSAGLIAKAIGGCTRNAIIGLALRAKVPLNGKITLAWSPDSAPQPTQKARQKINPHVPARSTAKAPPAKPAPPKVAMEVYRAPPKVDMSIVPVSQHLSLDELTDRVCRWPHGDPQAEGFHFCGNGTGGIPPYCKYHARIAYVPAAERRRLR